LFYFSFPSVF